MRIEQQEEVSWLRFFYVSFPYNWHDILLLEAVHESSGYS